MLPSFQEQVVLLTGSTGHLGACLLYKLILVVQVSKVYVLVRGTEEQTKAVWASLLAGYATEIMSKNKIRFIRGDLVEPNLGIRPADLAEMATAVTIVIHAAADIRLNSTLRDAVVTNCVPSLELARLISNFDALLIFVHVSTLYALSFLPDGPVYEKLYPLQNPEQVLKDVLAGRDVSVKGYAWPYARSKHLCENLLVDRHPSLPLMILRPSSIGPAIFQPRKLYGKLESIPINAFYARLMYPSSEPNVFHATSGSLSGSNILDEIPVDMVANVLLQNVQRLNVGVVHASSAHYVSRTFDDFVSDVRRALPDPWKRKVPPVEFTSDRNAKECKIGRFYRISTRNWTFLSERYPPLDKHGQLGMCLAGHDMEEYTMDRVYAVFKETEKTLQLLNKVAVPKV